MKNRNWMVILLLLPMLTSAQAPANRYKELVQKVSPSIVTVRAVVKVEVSHEGQSNTDEAKFSQRGTIITPDGLVLVSGVLLTSEGFKQLVGLDEEKDVEVKLTPQSFKVIIGQESQEYEATLVATDSQLGIAFLQIKDLGDRTLPSVQFKETPLEIGNEVYCVTRMPKGYDFSPYFIRLEVVAEVAKPRRVSLLNRSTEELGLPVFSGDGSAVGVIIYVRTDKTDEEVDLGFDEGATEAVLPTSVLQPLIEQAKKRAQESKR